MGIASLNLTTAVPDPKLTARLLARSPMPACGPIAPYLGASLPSNQPNQSCKRPLLIMSHLFQKLYIFWVVRSQSKTEQFPAFGLQVNRGGQSLLSNCLPLLLLMWQR